MLKKVSHLLKISAYLFFIMNILKEIYKIALEMSYLNTGQLMGAESMILMLWSCFVSFLLSLVIYGFAVIIEFYEKQSIKLSDDLTKL